MLQLGRGESPSSIPDRPGKDAGVPLSWHGGCVGGGAACFLWCLGGVGWLLSKSSLSSQAVPSLALWLERAGSSLGIFLCVPTGISRFLRLQSLIWDNEAKRKPRACTSVSFLGSRGPQTICLLPSTFQSLLDLAYIQRQGFYLYLRRIGKITPSSRKQKFQGTFLGRALG